MKNCWMRLQGNRNKHTHVISVTLSIIVFILALTAGSAWSLDTGLISMADAHTKPELNSPSSNSVSVDACLPLLKASYQNSSAATETESRQPAGKVGAVVFGIVLGARFALTPVNSSDNGSDSDSPGATFAQHSSTGSPQALAVFAYRSCVKQTILKEQARKHRNL